MYVPPFGALAERLEGTGAGWAWTDGEWRDEQRMLARIADVVAPENASVLAAAAQCASRVPQSSLASMAERTLAHYDAAGPASAADGGRLTSTLMPPFEWARVRGAERTA